MSRFIYKQIKQIMNNTKDELKNTSIERIKNKLLVGYYHPSNANWSYQVYCIDYKGALMMVACVFGIIH